MSLNWTLNLLFLRDSYKHIAHLQNANSMYNFKNTTLMWISTVIIYFIISQQKYVLEVSLLSEMFFK